MTTEYSGRYIANCKSGDLPSFVNKMSNFRDKSLRMETHTFSHKTKTNEKNCTIS